MNRIDLCLAIAHAMFSVASATAADGLSTNSIALQGTPQLNLYSWRQSGTAAPITSSALQPAFKPLDNQVAEYIVATSNQGFGSTSAVNRSAELAALVHPLSQTVQPLSHTTLDMGWVRGSSLNTNSGPAFLSPTGLQPSRTLVPPAAVPMYGMPYPQLR
ncbi:MAG: hypothetical protein AB7G28_02105 [Pirellulales bacterium]